MSDAKLLIIAQIKNIAKKKKKKKKKKKLKPPKKKKKKKKKKTFTHPKRKLLWKS